MCSILSSLTSAVEWLTNYIKNNQQSIDPTIRLKIQDVYDRERLNNPFKRFVLFLSGISLLGSSWHLLASFCRSYRHTMWTTCTKWSLIPSMTSFGFVYLKSSFPIKIWWHWINFKNSSTTKEVSSSERSSPSFIDGSIRWQSRSLQWKTRPICHVSFLDWPIRNSHRPVESDRTISLPCCSSSDLSPWQSIALNSLEIRQSDVWVIGRQRERGLSSLLLVIVTATLATEDPLKSINYQRLLTAYTEKCRYDSELWQIVNYFYLLKQIRQKDGENCFIESLAVVLTKSNDNDIENLLERLFGVSRQGVLTEVSSSLYPSPSLTCSSF